MAFKKIFFALALLIQISKVGGQVNLQTGSANFSLPVFNWQHDKSKLFTAVSLSYSSGNGLKVNDIASTIGQGWSLSAGGVITRLQVGEPDDQNAYNGNGTDWDVRKYPAGYLAASTKASKGCPKGLGKYPLYGSRNQVYTQHNSLSEDKQLDYFTYQFNGKAGMFVLDNENGDFGLSLGDTKMKITFQRDATMAATLGIRTFIKSFTITDADGMIYKFSKLGLTRILQSNYCDETLNQFRTQPKLENGHVYFKSGFDVGPNSLPWNNAEMANPWMIGSWYLESIEDGLTTHKITFNYEIRDINHVVASDLTYYQDGNYSIIGFKKSITKTPELSSIDFPDGHQVVFNYSSFRLDLGGSKKMSSIDVKYKSRYLSRHNLNNTYLIKNRYGNPQTLYQAKFARLYLKSITKYGPDLKEATNPYIFDYYLGSNGTEDFVPPPYFYAKDIWGYFNGNLSESFTGPVSIDLSTPTIGLTNDQIKGLCFVTGTPNVAKLNAKPGYAKNGLLRQIIYPTGGTLTYEYEQNTGVINGSTVNVGGVHVSATSSSDGGYSHPCTNPLKTLYHYVVNGPGSASSLWGLEMPKNSTSSRNIFSPEHKSYKFTWDCLPLGCCYYKFMYPGILSQNQATSLSDFQKFMEAAAPVLGALNMVTTIIDVINLACVSTGFFAWAAVVVDIIGGIVTLVISCATNYDEDKTSIVYYNFDLNSVSPLPTQFKRVEVVESPGNIGKTVHEFTNSADYAIWEPTNPEFSAKQRFAPWAYGLPRFTRTYNAAGNLVKQVEYEIQYFKELLNNNGQNSPPVVDGIQSDLVCAKCVVKESRSQRSTDWTDPSKYNDPASYLTSSTSEMDVDFYGMYTGRAQLNVTMERTYDVNNVAKFVEKQTTYTYNPNNLAISGISIRQSNGIWDRKVIKYSVDFTGGIFTTMAQKNMLTLPVSEEIQVGSATISESATDFIQLASGDIRPGALKVKRYAAPTVKSAPGAIIPSDIVTQTLTYDTDPAKGNLIGLKEEGSRVTTNIYDYDDKYIVAKVENADVAFDKASYTSFETNTWGGWTKTGSAVPVQASSVTGDWSFPLSAGNSFSTNLNALKPYKLSFWSTTGTVSVNAGATLVKSAPSINGFTYYEYDITAGNTSVTVSGTGTIDELRVYPAMARMSTTTYDPLLGKTSESDVNNRITYYEYDNSGRLKFIKDDYRNVVKMYEYNIISPEKQVGCPGIYYNKAITEIFTRSCSPGYLGSDVPVTIAANTYSSTISQEDADRKAEELLMNTGMTAAQGGTCSLLYGNTARSETYVTESCAPGYDGGNATYTVPANRYYALTQAAANAKRDEDILANGWAYANDPDTRVCNASTTPQWDWDRVTYRCQTPNGVLPAKMIVRVKDINPNSPTYNQYEWKPTADQGNCPSNTYFNADITQSITRQCSPGYAGSSVQYFIPAGTFSGSTWASVQSQVNNHIATVGQAYADSAGTCTAVCAFNIGFYSLVSSNMSSNGTTVSFAIVFSGTYPNAHWQQQEILIGNIVGCRPSVNRVLTMNETGRQWQVTIKTNGDLVLKLMNGAVPSSSGATISLTGGSYNL